MSLKTYQTPNHCTEVYNTLESNVAASQAVSNHGRSGHAGAGHHSKVNSVVYLK